MTFRTVKLIGWLIAELQRKQTHAATFRMGWLKGLKVKLPISVWRILRGSTLTYFAPLVGAVKGVSAEYKRLERDRQRRRHWENV